jgi:hypothetical protein
MTDENEEVTESKPKGRPAGINVEVINQIGMEDKDDPTGVRQVMPGERVRLTKEVAQKLSDAGAVRIIL